MKNKKPIPENVKRMLYAESMGRCMNPACEKELFLNNGDIAEKAHIFSYCETKDNSFDNLILLCPNCHTNFDKNSAFNLEDVRTWKLKRQQQVAKIFAKQFDTFNELEQKIKPFLEENKTIYENYYLKDNQVLWSKFEEKLLTNNEKLKLLLENNKKLIQTHCNEDYSNLNIIMQFLLHVDEFKQTRGDVEKVRQVLFPKKINSIFGVSPIDESLFPSTESLECLITKLQKNNKFIDVCLGIDNPYIEYKENGKETTLYLNDIPRLRQVYYEYDCFRPVGIRLESLNFALRYMKNNGINFIINDPKKLSNITVNGRLFKFIYEYCLSKAGLISLAPSKGLIIVNLHNWNGESCISREAYEQAEIMDVKLLTMNAFYEYIHNL